MSVDLVYALSAFDCYLIMHISLNQVIKPPVKNVHSPRGKIIPGCLPSFLRMSIAGNGVFFEPLGTKGLKMN